MSVSRREFLSRSAAAASVTPAVGAALPASPPPTAPVHPGAAPSTVELNVNGTARSVEVETRTTLLEALRWKIGLSGTKEVCDRGSCGACTVLVDGRPTLACMTLALDAVGAEVTTVEGIGTQERLGRVQKAFAKHDALQCGYCIPGFLMSLEGKLRENPSASAGELKHAVAGNLCRCGSYGKIFDAIEELAGNDPPLGNPENAPACLENERGRVDAPQKLSGAAVYSADLNRPGMLFARHVLCPYGKARLVSADVEAVRRLPGVVEVEIATGKEYGYSGAPVGHVCADSPAALRDAVQALRLEWEAERVETDPYRLHGEQHGAFPPPPSQLGSGTDVAAAEQALQGSDIVVEATYETQIQTHSCLEPHGGAVDPTVQPVEAWMSTQGTFTCVSAMERGLELEPEDFQVKCEFVGGGFGSKFGAGREGLLAAQLARRHDRPVRVFNDREGEQLDTGNRPGSLQWMKIGADSSGKIQGGFVYTAGIVGIGARGGVVNPSRYDFGKISKNHQDIKGTHGAPRAFRAPGHPQGMFAVDSMIDELAEKVGLDPIEMRIRNEQSGVRREMLGEGARAIGWDRRQSTGSQRGRIRRGFGAGAGDWGNGKRRCAIRVRAGRDGRVTLFSGTQDIGQGHRTIMADLCADTLGIDRSQIDIELGNSHYPDGPASGGSTTARVVAPAVRDAAAKLLERIEGVAGSRPASTRDWENAFAALPADGIEVEGRFNDDYWGRGGSETVQLAEVVVDAETGVVTVEKIVAIQACGLVANRILAENQVIGGVIQGLSYALFEDRATDPQLGYQLNADLEHYKIAGALDIPEIVPILWGEKDGMGVRSLGEPPMVPTPGAIANAVANALGARVRSLPITPERVLRALEGRA